MATFSLLTLELDKCATTAITFDSVWIRISLKMVWIPTLDLLQPDQINMPVLFCYLVKSDATVRTLL